MDNSILAKPGTSITYKEDECDSGYPKLSRDIQTCPVCCKVKAKDSDDCYVGMRCCCDVKKS